MSVIPPIEEQTAAYKLFHYYFEMTVPQIHLMGEEFVGSGMPMGTGDKQIDRELAMSPQHCRLTIAQMAEFYAQGVPMRFVEPKESVRVYEIIQQHLKDWLEAIRFNVNVNDAPIEDLETLDRFAEVVYGLAKHYWEMPPAHTRMEAFRRRRGGMGRFMKKPIEASVGASDDEPVKVTTPTYTPMREALTEAHVSLQGAPYYNRKG